MDVLKVLASGGIVTPAILCAATFAMIAWYQAYRRPHIRPARNAVLFSFLPLATAFAGVALALWEWQRFNRPFDQAITAIIVIAISGLIFTAIPLVCSLVLLRRLRTVPEIAV